MPNVGIGTTTPSAKLDVKGDFAISGATSGAVKFAVPAVAGSATYTWPAAAPGSNMVLQSDSSGNLSWVADATGGAPVDASYAAKGVVQFDTDAATSGITVASGIAKLATSGVVAATYGTTAAKKVSITVDAFGRITTASEADIAIAASQVTSGILDVARGGTGTGTLSANRMFMANGLGTALIPDTCTIGQVLEYDGTVWACKASNTLGPANAYVQSGNAFGAKAVLGTTDNNALEFITNNTAKMTVLANGNVGIGVGSPTSKLDFGIAGGDLINFWGTAAGNKQGIGIQSSEVQFYNSGGNHWSFNGGGALQTSGTNEVMRINVSGSVGIGTTAPSAKLDVKGDFAISGATSGAVKFAVPAVAGSATYTWPAAAPGSNMVLQSDASGNLSWVSAGGGGNPFLQSGNAFGAKAVLGTTDNNTLEFITNNTAKMTILSGGNVGVAASTPLAKFHINDTPADLPGQGYNLGNWGGTGAVVPLYARTHSHNGGSTPAVAQPAMVLAREGVSGQSWSNIAEFNLSRYENISDNARTRFDIALNDGSPTNTKPVASFVAARSDTTVGTYPVMELKRNHDGGGGPFPQLVAFKLGRYQAPTGGSPDTRLDIALKSTVDMTPTADTTIMTMQANGYVGIGTTTPRSPADINGTILTKASTLNGTANVNFLLGNIQHTAASCGAFNLYSMKDGGSYTFVVKGGTSATCTFNAYSSADNSVPLTVHMPTDHAATVVSKHTIYTFLVVDTDVYVSWIPGM